MKALVTGGNGFIGRYVVNRLLERGMEVRSVGRSPQPELSALGVETVQADLQDVEAMAQAAKGVGVVFHVAARAGIWGRRPAFAGPNIDGTQAVLAACRKHGVPHLVYTSTPSVVFNRGPFRGEDERLPYGSRWLCHYAETKAIAEAQVLSADSGSPEGLRTVALRPHLVWGPGDPHILPRIVARARAGRMRIIGEGTNQVDISYVENVADAHLNAYDALLAGKAGGRAYFISQGKPVALWPWINEVLQKMDLPPIQQRVPAKVGYALGACAEAAWRLLSLPGEPPMTRFVATELAKDHYFDISAARADLGYVPKVSTAEGVLRAVEDLKARGC